MIDKWGVKSIITYENGSIDKGIQIKPDGNITINKGGRIDFWEEYKDYETTMTGKVYRDEDVMKNAEEMINDKVS